MRRQSIDPGPVGVVPRREAKAIQDLILDQPEHTEVAESVDSPTRSSAMPVAQWLSSVTALGLVSAAVESLKLTR